MFNLIRSCTTDVDLLNYDIVLQGLHFYITLANNLGMKFIIFYISVSCKKFEIMKFKFIK